MCLCQRTEAVIKTANAFSEVTVDLTTNTDISDSRGDSPCAPTRSQFLYLLGYFSLSPCFFLLTSSTSNGHHSLGHPKSSWIRALAALHLLVSQLMGSWQPFSLYKDRVQAALWCCQTMTSTGLPADFFALSPWEQKATGKHLVLYQAPRQYGFSLCYCVEQAACPVLDLYEGCFHLIRMLCISVVQVVPPIEPIQATSVIDSLPEIQRNNSKNKVQSLPRIYVLWIQKHKGQGEICISDGRLIYFCSICLLRLEICGQKGVIPYLRQRGWNSGLR